MKTDIINVISDFKENGVDTEEYKDVVNDLMLNYTTTEEYGGLPHKDKCNMIQRVQEIKKLVEDVGKVDITGCNSPTTN